MMRDKTEDKQIIVVGAGPAGLGFAEELLGLVPRQRLLMFSGEAHYPYDRVKLSSLLAGNLSVADVYPQLPANDRLQIRHNCVITRIDRQQRLVIDGDGNFYPYEKLVLATGSRPFIPSIPGTWFKRVYTFRDLWDTEQLLARSIGSVHTLVIGGGLLGLEAARALCRNGARVTLVQQGAHLMNRQLDAEAAALLQQSVERLGVQVHCDIRVKEIVGAPAINGGFEMSVTGVSLLDGTVLPSDTVVIATGISPRIELAQRAGIAYGRGIAVNEQLQTSDPDIYAIGECAEYRGQLYGLVTPGLEQAAVAARVIAGQQGSYQGSLNTARLKVVGQEVFSIGEVDVDADPSLQGFYFRDRGSANAGGNSTYRAVFVKHNRIRGALSFGPWPEYARVAGLVAVHQRLGLWRRLRFRASGNLFAGASGDDITTWPKGTVVCNCTGVTCDQLAAAFRKGYNTVPLLSTETGAARVCGSCQPLLAKLAGGTPEKPPLSTRLLLPFCVLGLTAFAFVLMGPVDFSTSVQEFPALDQLWLDSTAKQITGFTLFGLSLISLFMSLNKRYKWFSLGTFTQWRLLHTVLGTSAIAVLLFHTGFNLGANLNRWLMLDFLAVFALGIVVGLVISAQSHVPPAIASPLRTLSTWVHRLTFWPLPALLAFHVLSVYYF